MATKTFYFKNAAASGSSHGSLQDGGSAPGAATTATGWVPGTNAVAQACLMVYGTEVARNAAGWGTTLQPTAALGTTDAWRSENTINGDFANANWTITFQVRSVTAAYTGRFKLAVRVWRSTNANGSGATELTGARVASAATSASLTTTSDTQIQFTWSPGATKTLTDEYLFVNVGIEITTQGGGTTQDMDFRVGSTATIVTSDFTPATQALTPSLFQEPDALYTPTVSHVLPQASRFDNSQTFYTPTVAQPDQTLTVTAVFTNTPAFYAPTVDNLTIVANSPADAGSTGLTPTLEFTGTSANGSDLVYEVQVATDSGFSSIVLDKNSANDAGFANTVNGGDTSPFTSGEKVSYTVQGGEALSAGTYYWRARAKVG